MGCFYFGAFPPGYGGVTIKNQNLYIALRKRIEIKKVDFNEIKRGNIKSFLQLALAIIGMNNQYVVGVSGKKTRKRFCSLLYYINRKALNKSIIMLMGGTVADDIANDAKYKKYVKEYRKIYVETSSMMSVLHSAGLNNISIYPNGRFKPNIDIGPSPAHEELKIVFFSLVSPQKGVNVLIESAKESPKCTIDIYGEIAQGYRDEVLEKINQSSNIHYKGVFTGSGEEVYKKLNEYDVLVFPTLLECEGVPGILVEAKIAGLACVVSDCSYNAELVEDGVEGIVIKKINPQKLAEVFRKLSTDKDYLSKLKQGSYDSSSKYYIENYIDSIEETIRNIR